MEEPSSSSRCYDPLFRKLTERFRQEDGWEARQEVPPEAYMHLSKPSWGDDKMDGIHLETYILENQIECGFAPVALHCERGCPFQKQFMQKMSEKAESILKEFPEDVRSNYKILGPGGCSVFEAKIPLDSSTAEGNVGKLAVELERLQGISHLIDDVISECQAELNT